jgi:choline-sulfatase
MLTLRSDDRFCLLHWILDPHAPFDPPPKFADRIQFDDSQLPVPREYYSKAMYNRAKRSLLEQAFIQRLYVAEIESVDERIGFVIAMLKHLDQLDNTYIIFTSDHGEQFGEHGLHGHGGHGLGCHYYEGLVRVPLILFGPNLPKGKTVDSRVTLLDLAPTLKDLLGLKYPDRMQGRSWSPLIFENAGRDGFLYLDDIQDHDQIDALIEDHYKLIALKNGRHELYEITTDPRELTDYAPRQPQRIGAMMEKIIRMRNENGQRRKNNMENFQEDMADMPPEEREKLIEKLKALGSIK